MEAIRESQNEMLRSATVCFICSWLVLSGYAGQRRPQVTGDSRLKVAQDMYPSVLSLALGKAPPDLNSLTEPVEWIAVLRVVPPHQGREVQVRIEKMFEGSVRAEVVAAKGESILVQLRALVDESGGQSPEKLAERVAVVRCHYNSRERRELPALARRLERLTIPVVPVSELSMDSQSYEVWLLAHWGERVHATFSRKGRLGGSFASLKNWADLVTSTVLKWCRQ